jgi:hypothetical protein
MLWRRSSPADFTQAKAQVNLCTWRNLKAVASALVLAHFADGNEESPSKNREPVIRLNT